MLFILTSYIMCGKIVFSDGDFIMKIALITTGGTVSCQVGEDGLAPCSTPQFARILINTLPDSISRQIEITPIPLMNIDSTNNSSAEIKRLAYAVNAAFSDFDGIVITHGTDTMAYTAAMLSAVLKNPPVPVVLTGSQRPLFSSDSDAPKNLAAAFSAAADIRFKGIYIAFGNRVIAGRFAHKYDSLSDNAFVSVKEYAAEIADNGSLCNIFPKRNEGKYSFCPEIIPYADKIANITVTPYTSPAVFSSLRHCSPKGLIIEGYGLGGIPEKLLDTISQLVSDGVTVLMISNCLYGGVSPSVYEVGTRALRTGVIFGDTMTLEATFAYLAEYIFSNEKSPHKACTGR